MICCLKKFRYKYFLAPELPCYFRNKVFIYNWFIKYDAAWSTLSQLSNCEIMGVKCCIVTVLLTFIQQMLRIAYAIDYQYNNYQNLREKEDNLPKKNILS